MLASCGGGGGNPGTCFGSAQVCSGQNSGSSGALNSVDLPLGPPSKYAGVCTVDGERTWVRSHLDDVYLWFDEIINLKASNYPSPETYFDALLVKSKDRFSFTWTQAQADAFFSSGSDVGYGFTLVNNNGNLKVAFTETGSPAAQQNIGRGAQIVGINGSPISQLTRAAQIAALYPDAAGQTNQFEIQDLGALGTRNVTLTSATVIGNPVPQNTIITTPDNRKIGYLVFNDHIQTAEAPLISSLQQFQQSGINDLVLDMRYNGGGYLYIAEILASMIGGTPVQNKVFEQLQFNSKHPEKTNDPNNKFTFSNLSSSGQTLPLLNLSRVFVLTTSSTCSASEAVINGLSPFVQVITIGGASCGKPYGFIQKNNCGTAYFAIEFSGLNDAKQAVNTNGIAPTCPASDDLSHALGDSNEGLLSAAISYSKNGRCPASAIAPKSFAATTLKGFATIDDPRPWKNNLILK